MKNVFLGLGSNLGEGRANLYRAIDLIGQNPMVTVVQVSAFYETKPVGCADQQDFLNAVAQIETTLAPRELLDALLDVESQMGRVRTIRWGPRVIDIDILLYNDENIAEEGLVIPHPRMLERKFVLEPLAEIAPDIVLPDGRTAAEAAMSDEQ